MTRWLNPALAQGQVAAERVVLLAGLGLVLPLLGDAALYVVLPTHTAEAGILVANLGLMFSANRLIRIVLNSPLGVLIERWPRRPLMLGALAVGALSTFLYTIPGYWPLLVGRLLWGVAWIGLWMGGSTVVLDVATHANRGRLVGRFHMWFFVGIASGSLLGGLLTDWLGYRATFAVAALLPLMLFVVWWLFLPETRPQRAGGLPPTPSSAPSSGLKPTVQTGEFGDGENGAAARFSRLELAVVIGVMGLNWLIFIGIMSGVMTLLLQERFGDVVVILGAAIPLATFSGGLIAINQGVGLVVAPAAGRLSDHFRNRWGLVAVALALGIVALSMTAVGGGLAVVVGTTLGAAASSVLQTQVITVIGDHSGANRQGRFLGMVNTAGDLGSAAGPLIAFRLHPAVGMQGIFTVAALLLAAILPGALWAARREFQATATARSG